MNNRYLDLNGLHQYDQKIKEYIADISSGSGGLTEEAKIALLNCFAHVAWADNQGQTYYNALEDALNADPEGTVTSIDAVYTQGGTVYTTDSLDVLRPYLVVTAHYSDSPSRVVTTYTLSGTLTTGTSTITVSYKNRTATFDVSATDAILISSYYPFERGYGTFYQNGTSSEVWKLDMSYVKGASAQLDAVPLEEGDTISLPDYTNLKYTLVNIETQAHGRIYVATEVKSDYTLTAQEAQQSRSIIVSHRNSDEMTADEIAWIDSNMKIIRTQ